MKLQLLAECVDRLAQCDIDNPADQKTISVCENYVLESYKYYLESCEENGYEPLNEQEYIAQLMLNESVLSKIFKIGAGVGAGLTIAKGVQAVNQSARVNNVQGNFIDRAKAFKANSGSVGQMASNVLNTSARTKKATAAWDDTARQNVNTQYQKDQNGVYNNGQRQVTGIAKKGQEGNNTVSIDNGKRVDANSEAATGIQKKVNANNTTEKVNANNAATTSAAISKIDAQIQELQKNKDDASAQQKIKTLEAAKENLMKQNTSQNTNSVKTESLNIFEASKLTQPLTPSIKMPARYKDVF